MKVAPSLAAPGWVAPGGRVYAVGDVHGCAGRLDELHRVITADQAANPAAAPLLIHLGDYIDRGPDSAGTVARLSQMPALGSIPVVNLRGNHEQMMLDALGGDPEKVAHWLRNNGAATLAEWGVDPRSPAADWPGRIPPAHLAFLAGLPLSFARDGYLFVHAGIRPWVPLEHQSEEDLLWIREEFLHWTGPYPSGLAIVHGHTPSRAPQVTAHRINVDTGAVRGGKLTCAVLEAREVRFLAV